MLAIQHSTDATKPEKKKKKERAREKKSHGGKGEILLIM